jgi:hypothetical protein
VGMLWENPELAVNWACCVADVYVRDSAVDKYSEGFAPDLGKALVQGIVDLCYASFFTAGF